MDHAALDLAPAASAAPAPAAAKRPDLLGPRTDVAMIGGLSIAFGALIWLTVDGNAGTSQISWVAFYLAFLVNNPHFMASYVLLYWDKRKELLKRPRFVWAALVAPALIAAWLAGGVVRRDAPLLGHAVNFMYFTVGWHYIKQIYGTIVVTNARRGYHFTKGEGRLLKANLYPVWFMSFINGNKGMHDLMQYGIRYQAFDIPDWVGAVNYGLLGVSLAVVAGVVVRRWLRDGRLPAPAAFAAFAAIYVWYLPTFYHVHFFYLIPLFHSLQYLLFVVTMKKNQFQADARAKAAGDLPRERGLFLAYAAGFTGFVGLSAWLAFYLVPNAVDHGARYDRQLFGGELAMFCGVTFINIHHYFIDNVIWRRDNPAMKKYLVG